MHVSLNTGQREVTFHMANLSDSGSAEIMVAGADAIISIWNSFSRGESASRGARNIAGCVAPASGGRRGLRSVRGLNNRLEGLNQGKVIKSGSY